MNNEERAHMQTVRRVEALLKKWRPAMSWLGEWELSVIAKEPSPLCVSMSVYYFEFIMKAELWVHPPAIKLTDHDLEQVFLHECGHLLLVDLHNHFRSAVAGEGSHRDRSNTEERLCWRFAKSLQGGFALGQSEKEKR